MKAQFFHTKTIFNRIRWKCSPQTISKIYKITSNNTKLFVIAQKHFIYQRKSCVDLVNSFAHHAAYKSASYTNKKLHNKFVLIHYDDICYDLCVRCPNILCSHSSKYFVGKIWFRKLRVLHRN